MKPMSCPPLPQCVFHTNLIGRLNLLLDKWKSWGFSWSWACSFKCFMRLMCWGEGWKKKRKDVWNHFFLLWTMAMPWNLLLYTYVVSIYNQSNSWADDVVSINQSNSWAELLERPQALIQKVNWSMTKEVILEHCALLNMAFMKFEGFLLLSCFAKTCYYNIVKRLYKKEKH